MFSASNCSALHKVRKLSPRNDAHPSGLEISRNSKSFTQGVTIMRKRNWRLVIFGGFLIVLAAGFFALMTIIAPQSLDPVTLMQTAGQASGVAIGVSVALIIIGLVGKKE
jgi:hypothetical protein